MTSIDIHGCRLELVRGDITKERVDAIVNAANSRLAGGGGVDGAIHKAGGPQIARECAKFGGCDTGDAKITGGGELPAKYVIHAVGPRYKGGGRGEAEKLASCYRRALEIAREKGLKSVAFPSISTGIYGYPVEKAAEIALQTIVENLRKHKAPQLVRMVLFSDADLDVYKEALGKMSS